MKKETTIKVLMVEPGKHPKEVMLDNSLDALQKAVLSALKGTSFRFTGSDTEEAGGEVDAYKRVLTFRSIKKL